METPMIMATAEFRDRSNAVWRGWVPIAPGATVSLPVIHVAGAAPGKTTLVTAGLHGDEYDGLEAALRLADALDPAALAGHVLIVPRVNVPAYLEGARWNSIDGMDLNRQFPGRAEGFLAQRIAYFVRTELLAGADLVIDLHGGTTQLEVVSYGNVTAAPELLPELRRCVATRHIFDTAIRADMTSTLSQEAHKLGIPAAVIEIGGGNRWSEQPVRDALRGMRNLLRFNGQLADAYEDLPDEQLLLRGLFLHAGTDGFLRPLVGLGDWVQKGQPLATIVDLLGRELETVRSLVAGVVNDIRSAPNVRTGEWLYLVGEIQVRLVYRD
jgi:predicted deacylase